MREVLKAGSYQQIPQLSSSRQVDVNQKFEIVPSGCSGRRRAVLIGINYVGQQGEVCTLLRFFVLCYVVIIILLHLLLLISYFQ